MKLKLSALCSKVLSLFNALLDRKCRCWVDDLCVSVNFAIHLLKHETYAIVEGTCRLGGRRFPGINKQDKVWGEEILKRVTGIVKAIKLSIEEIDETIITSSAHDSKLV